MKNEHSEGTFILGSYYSSEEVTEIETNPAFKNSLAKNILDLRRASEEFRQEIFKTKLFKLIDKILKQIIK
ncbi:hypothetical protein JCM1393_21380 [Clostridium carnis]